MKLPRTNVRRAVALVLALGMMGVVSIPSTAAAQAKLEIKNVAEKKLKQLPAGPLFWRIESLPTLAQAQAAAGELSLAAEISGKVWLFTLGAKGGVTPGATKVVEMDQCPQSLPPSTFCASTTRSGRPVPGHPYILIRAPKPSARSGRPAGPKDFAWREPC